MNKLGTATAAASGLGCLGVFASAGTAAADGLDVSAPSTKVSRIGAMQVLLVEDDEGVASALAELLDQAGASVVRTVRGADALHRVRAAIWCCWIWGCPTWTDWTSCAHCGVHRLCR